MNRKFNKENNKIIIKSLLSTVTRKGIEYLVNYMEEKGFFDAPCSKNYHLNVDGGLAQHSLSVFYFALHLNTIYQLGINIDTIKLTTILHDVCKMFDYVKLNEKWEFKKDKKPILHAIKSLRIINKFIKLTDEEKEMIKWHMGIFSEYYDIHKQGDYLKHFAERNNKFRNSCTLLYLCDHFSSMYLEYSCDEK